MKKQAIIGLIAAVLLAAGQANAATVLKFAHAAPKTDLQQALAIQFKKDVEKHSDGDLEVHIYPHGQLGDDSQMIDGVRSGVIDIEMSGVNNFTGLLPEAGAFNLPFMFSNRQQAYKVLDGPIGQSVLKKMSQYGMKGLGFPENGFREMTNNRGPIKEPSDLKGLRMRVNNSKALNDMFEILGANPQQIPVAELYTALENGVVNAQDHPLTIVLSFKFYEVQKYLSLTNHAYAPLALVMNLNKFNSLSSKNQKIIEQAAKDSIAMERKLSAERTGKMISGLKSHGMKVNRDVDTAAFRKAVKPVWKNFEKENGGKLVQKIQNVISSSSSD